MDKKFIAKVWINKANKQKLITIPSKQKINGGDYVVVQRVFLSNK